ncbi:GntR family transcriptional regulator [Salinisphaera sp. T31B1]|uniref:GntR family transcriptional regulator n=1 Tax=Salinisphaera sp. T31B1 TaxID=727963 RepID=UPI0033417B50
MEFDRPPSLSAVTAKAIADAIMTGQFAPGQRLREVEIASLLDISRAPLREALRELASDGLVEIRPNRGAFVADPSREEIAQMSVTRGLIEGAAARLVTHRAQPASLRRLEDLMTTLLSANEQNDRTNVFRSHWDFHRAVCEESGNASLLRAWSSASSLLRIYYRMQRTDAIVTSNRAFLKIIQEGRPSIAEAVFRGQIIRVAFQVVELEIPPEVAAYTSHYLDADGAVVEAR